MQPWISIATDGTITIMSAATEMGQGSITSLPLIIAEELDADWDKVKIVPAPVNEKIYGNPGFGGMMYTAGSNAVTGYYQPLRMIGAQVRRVLLDNSARKWGVPVEELTTEPSVVVHAKSGRKMNYGDIAALAEVPAKAPEIKPDQLKKTADFRLIGKDVCIELPNKGERICDLRDRRSGAGNAVWHGIASARRRIGPKQDRRRQGEDSARGHRDH